MKNRHVFLLALAVLLIFASCASAAKFDGSYFPTWFENEALWRSVPTTSFKPGIQNAPTNAQIETIMNMVIKAPTSGGINDFFFVVVKDVAQQRDVVGDANANDGTILIMVYGDRLLEENPRDVPFSPDRGYTSTGMACGYINIAAISQGFGTHFFLTPSGYYGNRPWIPAYTPGTTKPIIEDVYLKGKGYQYFVDGDSSTNPTGNSNGAYFDAYGNLKFVLAVIIGTLDETADAKATTRKYPPNWSYAK